MQDYVLITGATSGIGYETAKAFAGRGKNLIIVARREDRLHKLKEELRHLYPALDVVVKPSDLSQKENAVALYNSLGAYHIGTWINNAGFGYRGNVQDQELTRVAQMIQLNVEACALLSVLYARDYKEVAGAQLINVASVVGYFVISENVTYSATKFFVASFTEGLDAELRKNGHQLRAKVLAPAATETEFEKVASNAGGNIAYEDMFKKFNTAAEMAAFMVQLYESDKTVGIVNSETYELELKDPIHPYF